MSEDNFTYRKMAEHEIQKQWQKHEQLIVGFIKHNGYATEDISVNTNTITTILCKVDQRKQYFRFFHNLNMSDFKEVALNCFWYIKLHPLSLIHRPDEDKELQDEKQWEYRAINEKFAAYFILSELRALIKVQNGDERKMDLLTDQYIYELIYTLTFRDISKEALILLVETMAVLLGLNPYKP